MKIIILIITTLFFIACSTDKTEQSTTIKWENELSVTTFERAKKENKVILLNLEANWCHWCHVMHDSTYSNREVVSYINAHFIPIKTDQDATPELANRYRKYGWPATIFINVDGEDLVKKAGYINPRKFLTLLNSIIKNPVPEKESTLLAEIEITDVIEAEVIEKLKTKLEKALDYELGGFNQPQKYVDYETFEYTLFENNNPQHNQWAKVSAQNAKKLSDPAWGGIYQYSTYRDWEHLHFEKLLSIQARYLKIFTQAYLYFNDTSSLAFANNILAYSDRFLKSPTGLYGNAQDADLVKGVHSESYFKLCDQDRLKKGIPKVDTNTYTANNAEMIPSLSMLYLYTQKPAYKESYETILTQLLKRKTKEGLFAHSYKTEQVITLKDNLSMAAALINLTRSTNDKDVAQLPQLMSAIKGNFVLANGSFKSFSGNIGLKENPIVSENIIAARLFNWYGHYSHDSTYIAIAKKTYQFLITPAVAKTYYLEPGILSLQQELNSEPKQFVSLLIDEANTGYINKAKAMAPFYSVFKSYKPTQLPEDKKELFEGFEENITLVCTSSYCSAPIYDEAGVDQFFLK